LPGGFSRFCARIYGITRRSNDFKACLGLELRADNEVEAALRVSCFNFGPKGLSVAEAEPLPPIEPEGVDEDDEDDEADEIGDFFSFGKFIKSHVVYCHMCQLVRLKYKRKKKLHFLSDLQYFWLKI
jgi:hypothetical protein